MGTGDLKAVLHGGRSHCSACSPNQAKLVQVRVLLTNACGPERQHASARDNESRSDLILYTLRTLSRLEYRYLDSLRNPAEMLLTSLGCGMYSTT